MITEINNNGDLIVNFEVLIPQNHPILNKKIEDIEKDTGCLISIINNNVRII